MNNISNKVVLSCKNIVRFYKQGKILLKVLNGVNLELYKNKKVAITGSSGSGKSTLLHLLGGLDVPNDGVINFLNRDISKISDYQRCEVRKNKISYVFQSHHLLPEFSALENVSMPLLIKRDSPKKIREKARFLLNKVGIEDRSNHKPHELSGGERQRVAIARALIINPTLLLADEPTGNLDKKNASQIIDLFKLIQDEFNTSILVVTHDKNISDTMDSVFLLENGKLKTIR